MFKNYLKKLAREEKGLAVVLVAAAMTVLLGFTALVVDVGMMFITRNHLGNACDAAALAGAREIPPGHAYQEASDYLDYNINGPFNAELNVNNESSEITVSATQEVNYFFAGVLGFESGTVSATSRAQYGAVTATTGASPLAIPDTHELNFGEQYTLKVAPKDQYDSGNFGALALGGTGSDNYGDNLKYGYDGMTSLGDVVLTEPGNMEGDTRDGVNYRIDQCTKGCTPSDYHKGCPRIILVPVFDEDTLDGGRDEVTVVGFTSFFLEGVGIVDDDCEVTGTFIKKAPPPGESYDIDPDEDKYGLTAVKLTK